MASTSKCGEALHQRVDGALEGHQDAPRRGARARGRRGRRPGPVRRGGAANVTSTRCGARARSDSTVSMSSRRPSRTTPTRSATCCTSESTWELRKTVPAAVGGLARERRERLLHQGVEAAGRLVEHEQIGAVHEGLHQTDLLAVAARQRAQRAVEVELQPAGEGVGVAGVRPSGAGGRSSRPDRGRSCAGRARRSPGTYPIRARIAGPSRRASRPRIVSRPEVGRIRSSIIRMVVDLPAPLGPRKPNTSPLAIRKVRSSTPRAPPAVGLGEALGLDRRPRRHLSPRRGRGTPRRTTRSG